MIAFLLALLLSAHNVISVKVNPRVCNTPCKVLISVRIQPHEVNESVVIYAEGPNYSRASEIPVNATATSASREFTFPAAGEYIIVAGLFRHDGKTWLAGKDETTVLVQGN